MPLFILLIFLENIGPAAAGPAGPVPTPMYMEVSSETSDTSVQFAKRLAIPDWGGGRSDMFLNLSERPPSLIWYASCTQVFALFQHRPTCAFVIQQKLKAFSY